MNHPYLFFLAFESVKWRQEHCDFTEVELEEISLMSLKFLRKFVLNTCRFIHSSYRPDTELRSALQERIGISRQSDSCRCDQVAPLFTTCSSELILPEEPLSLLSFPSEGEDRASH